MNKHYVVGVVCCALGSLVSTVTACAPVGGTCNYVQTNERVRVVAVSDPVELSSHSGEEFEVMPQRFAHPPQVGQYYDIVVKRHTSGGCTPTVITSITALPNKTS